MTVRVLCLVLAVVVAGTAQRACAEGKFLDRSDGQQAAWTAASVVANSVPFTAVTAAPRCLLGYIPCKLMFATFSIIAAGEQVLLSGGSDPQQARAILHRGIGGDWMLTGENLSGDKEAKLLPDLPPPPPTR